MTPRSASIERHLVNTPPLTRLVVEFALAQAESDEFLSGMMLGPYWACVRRGRAPIDASGFRLSDLLTNDLGLLPG